MKITKLFDGVYEVGCPGIKTVREFEDVAASFGPVVSSNHAVVKHDDPTATPGTEWHIDQEGSGGLIAFGINYMLVMIACHDAALGTEIKRPDGSVFRCKVGTPYLVRWNIVHRGPDQSRYREKRALLRTGIKLDEAALDARASVAYRMAA